MGNLISVDVFELTNAFVFLWFGLFILAFFIYSVLKYIVCRIDAAFGFTVRHDIFLRRIVRQMRRRKGGFNA